MAARNTRQIKRSRQTPAEHAAQRAEQRTQSKRPTQRRRLATPQIVGGLVTVAAVVIIIAYAILRAITASQSIRSGSGPAVTNAAALNPAPSMLKPGQTAPTFSLKGVDGKRYNLAAQQGHPVLLEFFAVWCPHCQHEAPIIQRLKQHYGRQGVQTWAILANPYGRNYDNSFGLDTSPATRADLAWFSRTFGEHVPQLVDQNFHVVNEYGVNGYPGIYVIDKHGKIVYSQSGDQSYTAIAKAISTARQGS